MKKLLALNALCFLLPFAIQAKEITSANTLKVNSPDGLTSIKDLTAKLSVSCKYKSGIFWPENKSCGYKTIDLAVKDGVISIPATETFPGPYLRNQLIKNYEVTLTVSEGEKYLTSLTAYNEEALKKFSENKRDLNILRFNKATLGLSVDGQDFFGSALSKDEKAYLLISVSPAITESTIYDVLVSSSLSHYLESAENRSDYRAKLKDMKEIKIPDTILAYLGEEKDLQLKVMIDYSINDVVQKNGYRGEVVLPAKTDALAELGSVELKPFKK